jgi:hypothetical protein
MGSADDPALVFAGGLTGTTWHPAQWFTNAYDYPF